MANNRPILALYDTLFALAELAESRDPEGGAHLRRIRTYCTILARHLSQNPRFASLVNDDYVKLLYHTSPLHDVGKIRVPEVILTKRGRLDEREFAVMKCHAGVGADTLRAVAARHPDDLFLAMAIDIAQSHHEKWDGSGYPQGLVGEDIPLSARISAVADVYDALTSRRVYKEAFSHEESIATMQELKGLHLDPVLVDAFLECEALFRDVSAA